MISSSAAPYQSAVSAQLPAAAGEEAELATRRARIANLPPHPAFTAWANDQAPDPWSFSEALRLSLEAGDPEIIRLIQERFPSFHTPSDVPEPFTLAQVAVVSASGIKCAVHVDCPHDEIALLEQSLQGPCAIHSLKFSDPPERRFFEDYKRLFQNLPPSVKHVDIHAMGNIQSDLAVWLPETVESIDLDGTAGWAKGDRKALVTRAGLKSVSIDINTDHDLADWSTAFAEAGRRRPVERGSRTFCGSSVEHLRFGIANAGQSRNFSLKKLKEGIGTLLSSDTGIMRLSFSESLGPELQKAFAQVGMSALAPDEKGTRRNHTLQVIKGVPLSFEVEAYLAMNRRALNMAMKVGSAALSQDAAENYQQGGAVLSVFVKELGPANLLSHDYTQLLTLSKPASNAAREAAKEIIDKGINNNG